jgi:hypothetical protein
MSPNATVALCLAGAAGLAGATALGWLAPDRPAEASLTLVRGAPAPSSEAPLVRPGASAAASVAELEGVLPVVGAPQTSTSAPAEVVVYRRPPRASVVEPPVVRDAGLEFRAQAAAIVRQPDHSLAVLLAAGDGRPSRLLRVGDPFDERWRLTSLTMDEAVLGDGVTHERVPLYGDSARGRAGEP